MSVPVEGAFVYDGIDEELDGENKLGMVKLGSPVWSPGCKFKMEDD